MRTLTKESERKLISAIEKAATLVNDGMSPNEAIIKSASEANVPAGHINLMVHAYNTGRTTKQRENGESTLEKAAEFALADADVVLKALYPEQVKTSAEIVTDSVVSTEYALSAAGLIGRRKDAMRKAAAAQVEWIKTEYVPPPRDEHAAAMRAYSEKVAAQRAEEEKRREATIAYSKAATAMEELNTYFRTPGNMSFGDAVREVGLRLGDTGVTVLQKVAAVYPHFTKQADTKQHHFGHDRVYDLVQNVLDAVSVYTSAQSQVSVKKSEAVSQKTAPQFLTGSILTEQVEKPLTLKESAKRPPNYIGGDKNFQQEFADRLGIPNISPDYVRSTAHKLDSAERERARFERLGRKLVPETPAEADAREYQEKLDLAQSSQEFANAERQRQDEESYRIDRENADRQRRDAIEEMTYDPDVLRQKWREGVEQQQLQQRAERNQREEADRLADLDIRDKWREGVKKLKEEKKKKRQEYWDAGATAGKELARVVGPNKFVENATSPIKFIGEAIGGKGGLTGMVSELTGVNKDPAKTLREQYQQLVDPAHENVLKTIRAKGVLHDMILNDPVVSGYDPQDVAMAFNEIAELAPSLVDSPGMIRPLLRKRLESGQLADFDVKQILDMDKLRADRDKSIADTRQTNLSIL